MFYNNPSISPPANNMHQFSSLMEDDSNMNLLISPFEPDHAQLGYPESYNTTQPMVITNHNSNTDLYGASPIAMPNTKFDATGSSSSSPQYDMLHNFANEFISRSPESSSSADSNLVSPPHQYYPSSSYPDFVWPEANIGNITTVTAAHQPLQHNYHHNHSSLKRSASVPPHSQKFKPHVRDSMYNQFQVKHMQQQHNQQQMAMAPKPLPIQIQRVSAQNTTAAKPLDAETHRRQLDDKLEKVNFDDITVAELKEMLRERGLSATGRKAELMNRLKEEYELLMSRGGAAAVAASGIPATTSPALSTSSLVQRRLANMNIVDSPKRQQQSRLYAPYSPPVRHSSVSAGQLGTHRLASSVPENMTQSYLNDQFMMRKPSTLRKSIDEEDQEREWIQSLSLSPHSNSYYPSVPKIDESAAMNNNAYSSDVWDDQTLQTFLSQI
ncbi:unnamed protein product [Mucor circinelloides]|uniref:SAP domain-containing protein n=1 Tax=Mucor circinelloides f. circinelloides (strain 1006PhL) TaxID=1220926 RepID=S2J033_MUCC1|nr:hypothetical protein HMPREF1544_10350 [Mucor circinelloides 1006PhL]